MNQYVVFLFNSTDSAITPSGESPQYQPVRGTSTHITADYGVHGRENYVITASSAAKGLAENDMYLVVKSNQVRLTMDVEIRMCSRMSCSLSTIQVLSRQEPKTRNTNHKDRQTGSRKKGNKENVIIKECASICRVVIYHGRIIVVP